MRTQPRRTASPLTPLLVTLGLLSALVVLSAGWVAGGVVLVLALLLLTTAYGREHERRGGRGRSGGTDGGAWVWGPGDSSGSGGGCDAGGGSDGGGCGGE